MRVFLTPLQHDGGPSEMRVVKALTDYAISGIDIVSDRKDADLVVLHVIGRQERISRLVDYLKTNNQRYVVIQYCLRSTQKPSTEGWFPIWQGAEFVWSYYNLRELCKEDGTSQDFAFYHAPLGVDANVFQASPESERPYVICTSGLSKAAESVAEAMRAARRVNRPVFHLGPDLKFGSNITYMTGIDDTTLAKMYSQCEFVSGLRHTEGFELPGIEGLMCGARPIYYDQPWYRQWFDDFAEFIPERSRDELVNLLESVFRRGARPVTTEEKASVQKRFDWQTIIHGFWDRCLS